MRTWVALHFVALAAVPSNAGPRQLGQLSPRTLGATAARAMKCRATQVRMTKHTPPS